MAIRSFIPAFIWAAIIFVIISMPAQAIPDSRFLNIPYIDKIIHATMFFIFAFLLCVGFKLYNKNTKNNAITINQVFVVLIVSIIYGAATELIQEYFLDTRYGCYNDFVFNVIGIILGIIGFLFLKNTIFIKVFKFLEK